MLVYQDKFAKLFFHTSHPRDLYYQYRFRIAKLHQSSLVLLSSFYERRSPFQIQAEDLSFSVERLKIGS